MSDKKHITFGILGTANSRKLALTKAISKFLSLQQAQSEVTHLQDQDILVPNRYHDYDVFDTHITFETASYSWTSLVGPIWDELYPAFVTETAPKMDVAVLMISAIGNWKAECREHLKFIREQNISKLVVFINQIDLVLKSTEQKTRVMLSEVGFAADTIPFVSGNALLALDTPTSDPTAPEYQPVINLLEIVEEVFERQV